MRDEFGTFFRDEDFLDVFSEKGQPAESAWRLALVMVMQYAEGLTDRQAADAVRTRIDWKYALSLEITDPGFDFSVLSEFRSRLLINQAERCIFDIMVSQFRERGWIKERGNKEQTQHMFWQQSGQQIALNVLEKQCVMHSIFSQKWLQIGS